MIRDRATPINTTLILQLKGFKTQGFELLTRKAVDLSYKFSHTGILPAREKSYRRKIHLTINEIINKDFLKHLLGPKHYINYWVVGPKIKHGSCLQEAYSLVRSH